MTENPIQYPPAERSAAVEHLHGHAVADPYRWLEDVSDLRTVAWCQEQDVLAREWLDAMPGREFLAATLEPLMRIGEVSPPVVRGDREFHTRREPADEHAVLFVRAGDREWPVVDVNALDPLGTTTLDGWEPSQDGRRVAYWTSVAGTERSQLYVIEVDSGAMLDGPIDGAAHTSLAWLPAGNEFCYVRTSSGCVFHRRVYRHLIGARPDQDVPIMTPGSEPTYFYRLRASPDGRWLTISGRRPGSVRTALWLADLTSEAPPTLALDPNTDVRADGWVAADGRLYLRTTDRAANGRVCTADPRRPQREHWRELVTADPDAVLAEVDWLPGGEGVPDLLVVVRVRRAVTEISLHVAATGALWTRVEMPGRGTAVELSVPDLPVRAGTPSLWFSWTDFLTPPTVYGYSVADGGLTVVTTPPGAVAPVAAHTVELEYVSADGTRVPMFVVSPEAGPSVPRPALLGGYGGFGVSMRPSFSPAVAAWVAAGGVHAMPCLRGGGELGDDWHRAGMRAHKHRVFDDFCAAAEHLVEAGWCGSDEVVAWGSSNGGLLVGASLTRRPELFRAVVCSAPLLDMLRYERFGYGPSWTEEYGSASRAEEFRWLLSYSPYHRVRAGTAYPAVLFTTFESDVRTDPCHARKMCAALQHATTSEPDESPVLLRREFTAGHGARSASREIACATDQLSFLAHAVTLPALNEET